MNLEKLSLGTDPKKGPSVVLDKLGVKLISEFEPDMIHLIYVEPAGLKDFFCASQMNPITKKLEKANKFLRFCFYVNEADVQEEKWPKPLIFDALRMYRYRNCPFLAAFRRKNSKFPETSVTQAEDERRPPQQKKHGEGRLRRFL